jgi:deoxyribose-phosphate aldolase
MNQKPVSSKLSVADVAAMIDHSLLRPDMDRTELMAGFEMARRYRVATCCVRPCDIKLARQALANSGVRVSTVIAFPHGSHTTEVKVFEAERALDDGCFDLDVVLNIGRLKSADYDYVERELEAVVGLIHRRSGMVKVIFENCYLTAPEIVKACELCDRVGADYVKTSTGYGPGGATLEDVRLMRQSSSPRMAVKAAGGIRTLDALLQFRAAGARMAGTRSTQEILEEAARREQAGTLAEWSE